MDAHFSAGMCIKGLTLFSGAVPVGRRCINPAKNVQVTKYSLATAPNGGMMSPCNEGDDSSDGDSA